MYLLDETFHFGLQTPPSELDGDQFVRAHVRAVRLGLSLQRGWGGRQRTATRLSQALEGAATAAAAPPPDQVPSTRDSGALCPS